MWGSMLDDLAKKAGEAAEAASGLAADATTQLREQTAEGGRSAQDWLESILTSSSDVR